MPRPSKLTPRRHQAIITSIRNGATREIAAQAAGISPSTLYAWMDRGRRDQDTPLDPTGWTLKQLRDLAENQGIDLDTIGGRVTRAKAARLLYKPTPYTEFVEDIEKSDAVFEVHALGMAHKAGRDDWRFWITLLERRRPERYARVVLPLEVAPSTDRLDAAAALEEGKAVLKLLDGGGG